MIKIFKYFLLFSVFFTDISANASADIQRKKLNMIIDYVKKVCVLPEQTGSSDIKELSIEAKSELNRMLRKFVDIELGGSAAYKKDQYKGVLQKDLASVINESMKCRTDASRLLIERLLPIPNPLVINKVVESPDLTSDASQNSNSSKFTLNSDQVSGRELSVLRENNQKLKNATRNAKIDAEIEEVLRDYAYRHRVFLTLNSNERSALYTIIDRDLGIDAVEAYLLILDAGLGLIIGESTSAKRNFDLLLDAAVQIAEGQNIREVVQGKGPVSRTQKYVSVIFEVMKFRTKLDTNAVNIIRNRSLKSPNLIYIKKISSKYRVGPTYIPYALHHPEKLNNKSKRGQTPIDSKFTMVQVESVGEPV